MLSSDKIADLELIKKTLDSGVDKEFSIKTDAWTDIYKILAPSNGKYWEVVNSQWHATQVFEDEIHSIQNVQ